MSPQQWAEIRESWEKDPRDGYQWLVDDLELPVSKAAIRKRAIAEGWTKVDHQNAIVQAAETIGKRKPSGKPSRKPSQQPETIKTRKPSASPKGEKAGNHQPETIGSTAGNHRAETFTQAGNHPDQQSSHQRRGGPGESGVNTPGQGGDSDAPASVGNHTSGNADAEHAAEGEHHADTDEVEDVEPIRYSESRGISTDAPPKIGRESGYQPDYADQARRLCMLLNATDEKLAAYFEIALDTLQLWKREHPAFLYAIKEGRLGADGRVVESLYNRAVGMSIPKTHVTSYKGDVILTDLVENLPPDVGAQSMWLRNRQPEHWRSDPEPPAPDPKSMYPDPKQLDTIYGQSVTVSKERASVALNRMERLGLMGSMQDVAGDVEDVEEKPREGR